MRIITGLVFISLISLVVGAPTSSDDEEKIIITKGLFLEELVKYTAQHEIVNLLVPLNGLNFDESNSILDKDDLDIIFFVEADIDADGNRIDQGLYVFKKGTATKILDYGRDAAASYDDSRLVFFGAADGIYVYNEKKNSADKYGTVDDSIIGIAKEKTGDVIYILTENHELYKVTNNGETKEKMDDIVNAKQIVLDYSNNIYFYSDDKQPFVRTADGVKKIEGLPENSSSVYLIKPPLMLDDGVPFLVDNVVYTIYANGTHEHSGFEFEPNAKPSAYAPEANLIQYYAFDKKIFGYNIAAILLGAAYEEELSKYLSENAEQIRTLSTKTRSYRQKAQFLPTVQIKLLNTER